MSWTIKGHPSNFPHDATEWRSLIKIATDFFHSSVAFLKKTSNQNSERHCAPDTLKKSLRGETRRGRAKVLLCYLNKIFCASPQRQDPEHSFRNQKAHR